jgi:hypothetical protein
MSDWQKRSIINGLMGFEVKKWIWAAPGQAIYIVAL